MYLVKSGANPKVKNRQQWNKSEANSEGGKEVMENCIFKNLRLSLSQVPDSLPVHFFGEAMLERHTIYIYSCDSLSCLAMARCRSHTKQLP